MAIYLKNKNRNMYVPHLKYWHGWCAGRRGRFGDLSQRDGRLVEDGGVVVSSETDGSPHGRHGSLYHQICPS